MAGAQITTLRLLSGACAIALSRFTTTLDQDEALLSGAAAAVAAPAAAASATEAGFSERSGSGRGSGSGSSTGGSSSPSSSSGNNAAEVDSAGAAATAESRAAGSSGQPPSQAAAGAALQVSGAPLSEEMRLAVGYRAELKRLLLGVIRVLGARVQEVGAMPGLKPSAVSLAPLKKGDKPRAATSKGFGAGGRSSGGSGGGQ